MLDIVKYFNDTVWCRLGKSEIHNVGVFAIRDIPKGQELTDYYGGAFPLYMVTEREFERIHPEIRKLILQQTIIPEGITLKFDSPNSHQIMEVFMNHSEEPNSDGKKAIRKIRKGEEITKDYNAFIGKTHPINNRILEI